MDEPHQRGLTGGPCQTPGEPNGAPHDLLRTNETVVNVGNTNACVFPNLAWARTFSFYLTSYDSAGLEGRPSEAVQITLPLAEGGCHRLTCLPSVSE